MRVKKSASHTSNAVSYLYFEDIVVFSLVAIIKFSGNFSSNADWEIEIQIKRNQIYSNHRLRNTLLYHNRSYSFLS
jgi:hypothetical protein